MRRVEDSYQFLTGELRTTVPLIDELDHIYVDVVISGRSYRFKVDTGADSTVVPLDFNRVEIGFGRLTGIFRIDTGGTGLIIDSPSARADDPTAGLTIDAALCHSITIGGYTLHDMPIRLTGLATGAFSAQEIVGTVGGDVWRKFITWFDSSGGRLFVEPNSNFSEKLEDDRDDVP